MSVREASTLILVARSEIVSQPPKILTIQRSSNLNYLPNALVFPGGNFDEADKHIDWLTILPVHEQDVSLNLTAPSDAPVSKAISSRITAIRETFEECGLLFCKRYNERESWKVTPLYLNDAQEWKNKIRKNTYEFLNLCRTHRCYPDVKGLHLFSNWVSSSYTSRRYDCKFFVAIMDHIATGEIDSREVQNMEWIPISHYTQNKHVFLPPPQFYEASKLEQFENVDSLYEFLRRMAREKCESTTFANIITADGFVFLLPGDEKYDTYRAKNQEFVECDEDTLAFRCNTMHRIEFTSSLHSPGSRNLVIQNYSPKYYFQATDKAKL